jgi:TPR repeat protein
MRVPQDYAEAVRWYRKAAEQGLASAQFDLGLMYASGQGVPQDYVLAHMWLNLSASNSRGDQSLQTAAAINERRIQARDEVARKMTPDQIAEAQRHAREWKPKP